jgi:hypothetical protein
MSDVVNWIFYYPHPDSSLDVLVDTPNPFLGRFGHLWALAKDNEPRLVDRIGRAGCMLYIVHSSFLYTTGGFPHVYSSRLICPWNHSPPCSLAAEIGLPGTVMMAQGPSCPKWSTMSSLLCRLLARCMSLSPPKSVSSSWWTLSLPALRVL